MALSPPKSMSKAAAAVHKRLLSSGNKKRALASQSFFKTGPGEYSEGDVFLGIRNPDFHNIIQEVEEMMTLEDTKSLIQSPYHEQRFVALGVIRKKYEIATKAMRKISKAATKPGTNAQQCDMAAAAKRCYNTMKQLIVPYVNNWDLVDCFVPHVMGDYLLSKPGSERRFLYSWAKHENMWKRRSAVLTTFAFIRAGDYKDALALCKMLLDDDQDLMHKATGWMLREIGRNEGGSKSTLKKFLKDNVANMPRTMLRYSIEHLDAAERARWMQSPSSKKGQGAKPIMKRARAEVERPVRRAKRVRT
eukprot:TRINITY_DN62823_c0_g1_i1.p1 TRINITY_DN62823_c0_g1~~TRINITY_DN62823_c0_g1_i1.p1  ORF type:complete len:305 (-),score=50.66 TRINITY_DN62823_c0_g1_i1:83-997(-)